MTTMKSVVWLGPRQMNIQDTPLPELSAGEVLVRVGAVGICGSELSGYLGQNSLRVPPLVMGHEFAGEVTAVGEGVSSLDVGDPVAVNPLISCGTCEYCRSGHENLCTSWRLLGAHRPGAFAECVAVPAKNCIRLPDHIDPVAGALSEPLACGIRAAHVGSVTEGSRVMILGAGTIGLMCLAAIRAVGGTVSLVADINPGRLATARAWGAEADLDSRSDDPVKIARQLTDGLGMDVVIDAVGNTETRQAAVRAMRAGGIVVLLGLHEAESPLEANYVIRSEIQVKGSFAYTSADFKAAVDMLGAGVVSPSESWLEERPLAACGDSFAQLIDSPPPIAKIILRP